MDWRVLAAALLVAAPALTVGGGEFTSNHPEEAYPDPGNPAYADPYSDLIARVQQRLNALGFDAGPVNGDFSSKTQAALTQFQISELVPASGQLDEATLAALGVARSSNAATGGTGSP